jgi:hypothetical protein
MKRLITNDIDDGKSRKERNRNLVRIPITKFRDLLSQPPPRQRRIFNCVYLGNNKFFDLNNECMEGFLEHCNKDRLKNAKNNPFNKIRPFSACSFAGSIHYKRSDMDENKFDYFYIEQLTYKKSDTIDGIEKNEIYLYHPLLKTVDHEIFSNIWQHTAPKYFQRSDMARKFMAVLGDNYSVSKSTICSDLANPLHSRNEVKEALLSLLSSIIY